LNYEHDATYNLTIRATDDSVLNLFRQTVVTININDLNEGPVLTPEDVIRIIDFDAQYNSNTGREQKNYGYGNKEEELLLSLLLTINAISGVMGYTG
jgi:hypothetical protein